MLSLEINFQNWRDVIFGSLKYHQIGGSFDLLIGKKDQVVLMGMHPRDRRVLTSDETCRVKPKIHAWLPEAKPR